MRRPTPLVSFALLAAGCLLSFGCGPIGTVRHLPRDAGAQGDEGGADGSAEGTDAGEWESTDWLCSDGIDNDGNGHTDCDDWRCCEESVPKAGITVCEVGTCRAKGAGRLDASSSPGPDAQSDTTLDADTIEVADAGSQEMPDVGSPAGLDAASLSGPDAATVAVNCSAIEAASSDWEVCETGANRCAGVFNDGAGCEAFCAAAGMICSASFGGEPGCQKESAELGCGGTGHQSDWCECVVPQGGIPDAGGPGPRDPAHPPRRMEL
ncbi:MAG: hypothetical protein HY901_19215 [Deltaproteobacteria bacterium]|nr:hypothetical protein [Deltaproteobacteria bacterium]